MSGGVVNMRPAAERDELDRAVRRLEAERLALPPRLKPRRPPASVEDLRAFDDEWRAARGLRSGWVRR